MERKNVNKIPTLTQNYIKFKMEINIKVMRNVVCNKPLQVV